MATKQTTNPFYPFGTMDFSQFDPTKMLKEMKVPGVDMEALLSSQRRNIEALTKANQKTLEGMQAVARRQAEIMAQAMAEVTAAAQQLASAENPQAMSAKQAELIKQAFEKALANMRELAEMINKSNTEAFEIINKRVAESLEELRGLTAKTGAK